MATKIQLRRGTAAQWTSANPTLASGELGLETDTSMFKVGDGTTAWNSQAYTVTSITTIASDANIQISFQVFG
jgi:transcription elongation factor